MVKKIYHHHHGQSILLNFKIPLIIKPFPTQAHTYGADVRHGGREKVENIFTVLL